jgi:hypothetical protein
VSWQIYLVVIVFISSLYTGMGVLVARFASAEDARRNSDRREQGAWWEELTKHFTASPAVYDCSTVALWRAGGSDDAGFVQVITADVRDADRLRALVPGMERVDDEGRRPDVIGGVFALADDDSRAFEVVYFTSEEEARRGEAAMQDEPEDPTWAELSATLGEPSFIDLRDPWLTSP